MVARELPPEGDQAEADQLVAKHPIQLPKYRLERVAVSSLVVDYAPPHGNGYARPLSIGRLNWLRRNWDPLACAPLVISRRGDGQMYVVDGNHRRYVAYEKGMLQLPAMVHQGLDRSREAGLYTKLGTVLGQTPLTRFRSKLVAGDPAASAIQKCVLRCDLELDLTGGKHADGVIQAIARVEWIYARGGEAALTWCLEFLVDAFEGERSSLSEQILEGTFGFWLRYASDVNLDHLVRVIKGAGIQALDDRSASLFRRYLTSPGNSVGRALLEMYNASKLPQGSRKLGGWVENVVGPNVVTVRFKERGGGHAILSGRDPAPQQLGVK